MNIFKIESLNIFLLFQGQIKKVHYLTILFILIKSEVLNIFYKSSIYPLISSFFLFKGNYSFINFNFTFIFKTLLLRLKLFLSLLFESNI